MLWQILGGFILVFFTLVLIGELRFIVSKWQVAVARRTERGQSVHMGGYSVGALIGLALTIAVTVVGLLMAIGTIP